MDQPAHQPKPPRPNLTIFACLQQTREKSVSLYGRIEEGWRLSHIMDLPLTDDDYLQLSQNCGSEVNAAIFLLPYLPLATQLSIWDGKEPLYCCEDYLDQFRGESFIADVLNLETIPLQQTRRWPKEWDEPTPKDLSPLSPIADGPTRAFITEVLAEVEQPKRHSTKSKKKPTKTPKKLREASNDLDQNTPISSKPNISPATWRQRGEPNFGVPISEIIIP